jgi:hypothetical protein
MSNESTSATNLWIFDDVCIELNKFHNEPEDDPSVG